MKKDKQFWNKKANHYERFIKLFNKKAYDLMYQFIKDSLSKDMHALEVGTGTGLVARQIADKIETLEATDFSEEMITVAQNTTHPSNIHFSCADIFDLPFENHQFDVVIASNILHIIPHPERAIQEIRRVLKPNGYLIAPTFLWQETSFIGNILQFLMLKKQFPLQTNWNEQTYKDFIENNGFSIQNFKKIKTNFAIACVLARIN